MKRIPCKNCGAQDIGPPTPKHPAGAPVIFGYWSSGNGLAVLKCYRCWHPFKIGAAEFNRLPSLTQEELQSLGLAAAIATDQAQSGTTPAAEVKNG